MKYLFLPALVAAFVIGLSVGRIHPKTAIAAAPAPPTAGWTLHLDAQKHFGDAHPDQVAHHYCKPVAGGIIECQIYDSDAPDARLVEVETIIQPSVYKSLSPSEQALWHYHKVEIPKINATLPGMSPAQAAKVVAMLTPTYGKLWLLWDPADNAAPVGKPTIIVLK